MDECVLRNTEFQLFRELIYKQAGISLSDLKKHLVQSRLQRRLRHLGITRFQDYYDLLLREGETSAEMREFINCITTNKTDFYREPHHFEFVTKSIIPELEQRVRRGESEKKIRVWHAGCSTGEEPYTLAMTLQEALYGKGVWDVRQLASDIDTVVLDHASRGIYEQDRLAPVPPEQISRYFVQGKEDKSHLFRARQELRDQITFRRINLLDTVWPLRSDVRFDIIFCRNVIIYFDKPTQRRLFERFQQRLRPGGYLFIGHSESLMGVSDAFENLGRTIYRLPESTRALRLAA